MKFKTLTGLQNLFKSVVRPKSSGDFSAWLGNAQGTVVADDNNGVYIMDWNGNVRVVLNNKVPPYPFRPVRVGYVSETSKVLEVKEFIDAYPTQRPPNVPNHAGNHVWGGVDTLFIRGEQILPGVAIPDDDDPLVLHVAGFVYYLNGWHIIDSFTLDVTSYIPSTGAKFLLLEADDAGAITVQSGTAVDIREELVMEDIPSPTLGTVPLVAVMVYAGQVKIWKTLSKQDVVDLRWSRYATGLDTSITAPLYAGRHVAAADPTVTDDDTAGFLQLHLWLNSTTGDRFICTDNSTGAAVWESLTGGGGGTVESVTGDGVDNTDPANPVISYPTPGDIGAEPALGYTPENVANKSTDVDADKTSNTKYPSVKAVYDWALGLFLPYIGWKEVSDTWTYASPSTINIPSDGTTKYKKWMKIRIKQGGAYKYYFASNIASTLITVAVNTSYTVANAPITDIAYSFIDNPYGFPNNFNFTPTGNNFTLGNSTVNAAYTISRGVCKGNIFVKYPAASPTGTITGQIQVSCPVTPSTKLPTYTTVGAASMVDAATALYMCETILNTTLMEIRVINTAGTYAVWAAVSNTVPFTLGVNDSWSMEFSYLLDD